MREPLFVFMPKTLEELSEDRLNKVRSGEMSLLDFRQTCMFRSQKCVGSCLDCHLGIITPEIIEKREKATVETLNEEVKILRKSLEEFSRIFIEWNPIIESMGEFLEELKQIAAESQPQGTAPDETSNDAVGSADSVSPTPRVRRGKRRKRARRKP